MESSALILHRDRQGQRPAVSEWVEMIPVHCPANEAHRDVLYWAERHLNWQRWLPVTVWGFNVSSSSFKSKDSDLISTNCFSQYYLKCSVVKIVRWGSAAFLCHISPHTEPPQLLVEQNTTFKDVWWAILQFLKLWAIDLNRQQDCTECLQCFAHINLSVAGCHD